MYWDKSHAVKQKTALAEPLNAEWEMLLKVITKQLQLTILQRMLLYTCPYSLSVVKLPTIYLQSIATYLLLAMQYYQQENWNEMTTLNYFSTC